MLVIFCFLGQQKRFIRSSVNFDDEVDRQPQPLIRTGSGGASGSAIKFSDDQPVQTDRKGPGAFGDIIADQER